MRPVIGITANYSYDGSSEFAEGIGAREQEWQLLADDYVVSVARAGGLPVILPLLTEDAEEKEELVKEMLHKVDGLILSGGNDVDPLLYGEKSKGQTGTLTPQRDQQEMRLLDLAYRKSDKPILAICRGIQLLNVYFGGTLIQDIPAAGYGSHTLAMYPRTQGSHQVSVRERSLLYRITKNKTLQVNSFHHVAVKDCAPALTVTARAADQIIEAVELRENPDQRFLLGMQWHPEMMLTNPVQQSIFKAFVEAAQ